jgi:hypothetical protein
MGMIREQHLGLGRALQVVGIMKRNKILDKHYPQCIISPRSCGGSGFTTRVLFTKCGQRFGCSVGILSASAARGQR